MQTNTVHKRPFRVLLMNLGYATGIDGSTKSYLLRWYRYLYTPRSIIRKVRQSIYSLLNRENPDLCCFVEIHRKHGFVPHPRAYTSHIDVKYGRFSPLRYLPFFKDNCNGFFSHHPLRFRKTYFKHGTKKLVYEIDIGNGLTLILAHFSLRREGRHLQFMELKEMIQGRKNVIVCGDFNIFRGTGELHQLAEACDLQVVNAHMPTFPSAKPRKALDLFLCPKDMKDISAHVVRDVQVSDHLPVMLQIGA